MSQENELLPPGRRGEARTRGPYKLGAGFLVARRVRKQSRVVASSAADPLVAAMGKTCTLPTGQSQYQVVGRFVPNEKYGEGHAQCKVYRMKH